MGRLTSLPSAVVTDDSVLGGAVIERSLRFYDDDSTHLSRTPSSASNRRTWTWSGWVRRSEISSTQGRLFGAGNTSSDYFSIYFPSGDEFRVLWYEGSQKLTTSAQVFRDSNSWYHFVVAVDTTQAVGGNRILMYANGVLLGRIQNDPAQNFETSVNSTSEHNIGKWVSTVASYFDGYIAEVNFVDGFQLTPSSFGYTEFQTGIWRPKGYFGSYGTNGFRLDFSDNSATTAVTLGKDRSGQGNDFTPNNFSVSAGVNNDSFLESPTAKKEFATFNSNLQTSSSTEYKQGNLAFYTSGSATVQTRANMSRNSGKWYAEFTLTTFTVRSGSYPYIGVAQAENFSNTWTGDSGTAYQSQGGIWRNSSNIENGYSTYAAGDVISVAINLDSSPPQVWWAKNGSYIRSGANPSTLTAGVNIEPASTSGTYTFTASLFANPGQWDANFGQRPFAHSVPTGFKTLNTDNFSINTPSIIKPQKHFDSLIYSGTGSTQSITGLEFKPDLVWIKKRNDAAFHQIFDTVRGATKGLFPNSTNAEYQDSGNLQSFIEGGFTADGFNGTNASGGTYVAWCWKGGGNSNTFNVDGKGYASASAAGITEGNLAITGASINREAGFSIVKFTANNDASATIGHGLNSKPKFVVVKDTANSDDWQCKFIDDNMYVSFNHNTAGSTSYGNFTATDTLINLGYTWNNGSGTHVAYSWTNVPGYSKIGKYKALTSTDGAYVDLGFRPAFILIRPTNNFGGSDQNYSTWGLWDSARSTSNVVTYGGMLTVNTNYAEQVRGNGSNDGALAAFDILGTGFKVRQSSYEVGYSGDYYYMAFAEQPGESPYHTDTNAR